MRPRKGNPKYGGAFGRRLLSQTDMMVRATRKKELHQDQIPNPLTSLTNFSPAPAPKLLTTR